MYNLGEMEQRKKRKRQWSKEEIRALRQHMNLTQVKLADELGTRQQTISEWEKGMYRPRGQVLREKLRPPPRRPHSRRGVLLHRR